MPLDFNRIQQRRQEILARAGTPSDPNDFRRVEDPDRERDLGLLGHAKDILAAPLRGIEGALQDVYGLADTVLADALPDWEERVLGESETFVGSFIEGTSNFLAGFIPGVGIVSKIGKVAKIGKAATRAGRIAQRVGRDVAAGALADFAVFEGQEERLSNLIESKPELSNAVTAFLAADENDSEVVGRLKNVIEGAGLGVASDAMFVGLKRLWAMRKARAAGATPEGVEAAGRAAVPDEEVEKALGRMAEIKVEEPEAPALRTDEPAAETVSDVAAEPGRESQVGLDPHRKTVPEEEATPKRSSELIQNFGIDGKEAERLVADAERRSKAGLDPNVNPRNLTAEELLAQDLVKSDLNLENYVGTEGAHQLLRTFEATLDGVRSKEGPISNPTQARQAKTELAMLVGSADEDALLVQMQRDAKDAARLNRRVLSYKTALNTYADAVFKKSEALNLATASDVERLEFAQMMNTLAEMQKAVKGLVSEQGRGLQSNQIPVRMLANQGLDAATAEELLRSVGGRRKLDQMAQAFRTAHQESVHAAAQLVAKSARNKGGFLNVTTELWMNSILSGLPTHVINVASGAFTSFYRPMELMLGGALIGDKSAIHRGYRQILNIGQGFRESLKFAKQAFQSGDGVLDLQRHRGKFEFQEGVIGNADSAVEQAIQNSQLAGTPTGSVLSWVGRNIINLPSRGLQGADEFFKQLNYRTVLRTSLEEDGLSKGLQGDDLLRHIQGGYDRATTAGHALDNRGRLAIAMEEGRAAGIKDKDALRAWAEERAVEIRLEDEQSGLQGMADSALQRAREVTFQEELGPLGKKIQELSGVSPWMRFVIPFVRTPLNIASFFTQRADVIGGTAVAFDGVRKMLGGNPLPQGTKLGRFQSRLMRDMASPDAGVRADATGRIVAGLGAMTTFGMLASSVTNDGQPLITGGGPADPAQRKTLEATGWRPYSFWTGGGYVSYARLDPIATFIGTAADMVQYGSWADIGEVEGTERISTGVAVALAKNLGNKTYMQGLSDFLDAVTEPEIRMDRYIQNQAASIVPSFVRSFREVAGDDEMREAHSIVEAAMARIPGLSDNLPPRRDLFGQPVDSRSAIGAAATRGLTTAFLPVTYQAVADDFVAEELAKLNHGFMPPNPERGGIDLREHRTASGRNAYDRYAELAGTIKVRGTTLKKAMQRLMRSRKYQQVPAESTPGIESPRISMVKSLLNRYRREAWDQLLDEAPDLARLELNRVNSKRQLLQGRETRTDILQRLR